MKYPDKKPKKFVAEFTEKQVSLIQFALHAALDQYEKHLMHDEWMEGVPKDDVQRTLRTRRALMRAQRIFRLKTAGGAA